MATARSNLVGPSALDVESTGYVDVAALRRLMLSATTTPTPRPPPLRTARMLPARLPPPLPRVVVTPRRPPDDEEATWLYVVPDGAPPRPPRRTVSLRRLAGRLIAASALLTMLVATGVAFATRRPGPLPAASGVATAIRRVTARLPAPPPSGPVSVTLGDLPDAPPAPPARR